MINRRTLLTRAVCVAGLSSLLGGRRGYTAAPPTISLWYGRDQTFGAHGIPQQWVNILGTVAPAADIAALSYSLNGGPWVSLAWGPNDTRLVEPGDFNAEIDFASLAPGLNELMLAAVDIAGQTTQQTVAINNLAGDPVDGSFTVDLRIATAATLQQFVQIVDGKWALDHSHRLRNTQRGYDRAFLIGNVDLANAFDLRCGFAVYGFDPGVFGVAGGWQGHTLDDYGAPLPAQPVIGHPFSNFGVVGTPGNGTTALSIYENLYPNYEHTIAEAVTDFTVGAPYAYHYRQTVNANGSYRNHLKIWPAGTAEPPRFQVEADTTARPGCLLFDAHNFDVAVGPVIQFIRH